MPYANNNGVKIYYEVEGEGPPLVLAHGFGSRLQAWRALGYAGALQNDFQLVLYDARGHGRSDKPHEPDAYGLLNMADDVVTVLNDIGINQAHYFGYSMGAKVGYRLATRHVKRFRSFVLGSHTPYRDGGDDKDRQQIVEMLNLQLKDPQAALLQREQSLGRPLTSGEREAFLANDVQALIAITRFWSSGTQAVTDHELSLVSVPCLVFCGDLDLNYAGAKEAASHIPHATFISLPSLNHPQAFARIDLVLPHVKKFLAEVNSRKP